MHHCIIFEVYVGPPEGSRNVRNCRKKILNIHGKILNWSKISFFDVRSAVFAHMAQKVVLKFRRFRVYINVPQL